MTPPPIASRQQAAVPQHTLGLLGCRRLVVALVGLGRQEQKPDRVTSAPGRAFTDTLSNTVRASCSDLTCAPPASVIVRVRSRWKLSARCDDIGAFDTGPALLAALGSRSYYDLYVSPAECSGHYGVAGATDDGNFTPWLARVESMTLLGNT